jgi:hypothetical protein
MDKYISNTSHDNLGKNFAWHFRVIANTFSLFENNTVNCSSQFVASSFHTIIALLLGLVNVEVF